jgi:hypothetical protein
MKPDPAAVLAEIAGVLGAEIAPVLPPFEGGTAGLSAALLAMVAEETDRAAHRRVEENRAIRALFAAAQGVIADRALAGRLAAMGADVDEDFRISALDRSNAELRIALIELHVAVEATNSQAARALEAAIWAELVTSTERRRFSSATV